MTYRTNLITYAQSILQYSSDLHLEKGFRRIIVPKKPNLVLAGDIGYPGDKNYKDLLLETSTSFDKVFVISGNHEYDYVYTPDIHTVDSEIENICNMRDNLFFLQKNQHLLCKKRKLFLAGCTLWAALPMAKYKNHLNHVDWLKNTLKNNIESNYVIATHHCPSFEILRTKTHTNISNYFATDQTELIKSKNVVMWIHGHNHMNRNLNIYGKLLVSNQYGSFESPLRGYK